MASFCNSSLNRQVIYYTAPYLAHLRSANSVNECYISGTAIFHGRGSNRGRRWHRDKMHLPFVDAPSALKYGRLSVARRLYRRPLRHRGGTCWLSAIHILGSSPVLMCFSEITASKAAIERLSEASPLELTRSLFAHTLITRSLPCDVITKRASVCLALLFYSAKNISMCICTKISMCAASDMYSRIHIFSKVVYTRKNFIFHTLWQ